MKKILFFVCLALMLSCQGRFEKIRHSSQYSVVESSRVYHYILYSPTTNGNPNYQVVYKDNLYKKKRLFNLRNTINVNVFYLDSNNQLRRRIEAMTSVVPYRIKGIADWGVVICLRDCDLLYLLKTKEFYKILRHDMNNYTETAVTWYNTGVPLRYEYKDLESYLTESEYTSCYGKQMYYYVPIFINKNGEIVLEPSSKGKLVLNGGYAMPTYDRLYADESKQAVASLVKSAYSKLSEQKRKEEIKKSAINPIDIQRAYERNGVNADNKYKGKYLILKGLTLTSISNVDKNWEYPYDYYVEGYYQYDVYGATLKGNINFYTDDKSFIQYNYPIRHVNIKGKFISIGETLDIYEMRLIDVEKIDL